MLSFTRWRRLSRAERRVVLEALLALPWAKIMVHAVRVDRLVPAGEGQTGVRPGSDQGQTGVRPGSDRGQTPVMGRFKVRRNSVP